jgi:hypothetical protein
LYYEAGGKFYKRDGARKVAFCVFSIMSQDQVVVGSGGYALIEIPKGDINNYYYYRQAWMAIIHVENNSLILN